MKKIIFPFLLLLFFLSSLHAEEVKIFDLKDQILQTTGKKIEKFKVGETIVSTNMLFDENNDRYYKKGIFSLTFTEPKEKLLIHLNLYGTHEAVWKFTDKFNESVYVYWNPLRNTFTVNNKTYKPGNGLRDFTIKVKNQTLILYANNKKVFTMGLDRLKDDIKTISFSYLETISELIIYQ